MDPTSLRPQQVTGRNRRPALAPAFLPCSSSSCPASPNGSGRKPSCAPAHCARGAPSVRGRAAAPQPCAGRRAGTTNARRKGERDEQATPCVHRRGSDAAPLSGDARRKRIRRGAGGRPVGHERAAGIGSLRRDASRSEQHEHRRSCAQPGRQRVGLADQLGDLGCHGVELERHRPGREPESGWLGRHPDGDPVGRKHPARRIALDCEPDRGNEHEHSRSRAQPR